VIRRLAPISVLAMNDMPGGTLLEEEDAVSESIHDPAVTYTITVLAEGIGPSGQTRREVLFRRTEAGHSIEIRAEVDTANLLAATTVAVAGGGGAPGSLAHPGWQPGNATAGAPT
jgi:hypothetical protein